MTPTNEMPLNVWCELRSSHPTERFVCIYTEPAKGRTKYLRATPDKVMIDRAELERVRDGLKFITNGCLVPPDGGSPIWPDDAIEAATKALQILEAAMKGEK